MEKLKLNIQMFADGKVVIQTDLDEGGFKSGLSKMKSIATKGFKAIGTTVGVASTAVTGLIAQSVNMAGQLEQNMGGAEAVFGDLLTDMTAIKITTSEMGNSWASMADKAGNATTSLETLSLNAYKTMGVSASEYLATINKMGSLMKGAGIDNKKALNLSAQAMQRAADVASIMGIDVSMAMESIAGAAKGNFTMMDNLGVAMNATTIEAYALSKGIKTSFMEMDNATKIQLAMEMFLDKTSYAMGNYAKENETFAGSFNTLKAAMSDFLSGAGDIENVTESLTNFGKVLVKSISEMAPTVVNGLIQLVNEIMPQIPELLKTLLPVVLEGAIGLINGLVAIFPAIITLIQENMPEIVKGAIMIVENLIMSLLGMLPTILEMGVTLLLELVKGIVESLPTLIPVMINTIMLIVNTLLDNLDLIIMAAIDIILALALGLIEALPMLIDAIPQIIAKIVTALLAPAMLLKLIGAALQLIIALGSGLIKAIPTLVSMVPTIIKNLVKEFSARIKKTDWKALGKNILDGILNGILNFGSVVKDTVKKMGNKILGEIKSFFGIKSPSRLMRDEVGKYIADGIGVGFEKEIDNVYDDMQKALDLETGKMTANVQSSGTYQMAMSGLPTFNLVDNATNKTQLVVNGKVLAEVVNTENRNREVATV